jgi:hypothetical protein
MVNADSQQLLDDLQRAAFGYFLNTVNPENGLIADRTAPGAPCSIAALGMALTAYPVGVERGFLPRASSVARVLVTLRFLAAAEQGQSPTASGYHGFFYHFLDMASGRRAGKCELSSLDTAILMAGILTAGAYFDGASPEESEIRALAETLYNRVDWNWMRGGNAAISLGWTPERGFMRWHYTGYSEALILYILALGSPNAPIRAESYEAWLSTYRWRRLYGIDYLHAGPLFIHQMPQIWIDFRGIRDRFMRAHDCDYFENSRRATYVQQAYAIRNTRGLAGYGAFNWGLTAGDGPGKACLPIDGRPRRFLDYAARGVPHGPDDGTIAPWAVAASLPFAPEIVLPTIAAFAGLTRDVANPQGFMASFNRTFIRGHPHPAGWVSPQRFGINEGPVVMMIENYRTGLIWSLTGDCPAIREGLRRADFQPERRIAPVCRS